MAAEAPFPPDLRVQPLRERLGQPVGQRFHEDRGVVVELAIVPPGKFVAAMAGRAGKRTDVVLAAALQRRNEVGEGVEHVLTLPFPLLSEGVYAAEFGTPRVVGEQHDVIADRVGGEKPVHAPGHQRLVPHHLFEQSLRIVEEFLRLGADDRIGEDRRILSLEFPRHEERRPVDERHQIGQRHALELPHPGELGRVDGGGRPVGRPPLGAGGLIGHEFRLLPLLEVFDVAFLRLAVGMRERRP